MKKKIAAILAAVFALAGAVGCGGNVDDSDVTLTIWSYYNGDQATAFETLIREFNETVGEEKGIFVAHSSKGGVNELIKAVEDSAEGKLASDELPNMAFSYADTAYDLDAKGVLANLDNYFNETELDAYAPGFIEEGRWGTGLKIFPFAKSTEIMVLNRTDWDKFVSGWNAVGGNEKVSLGNLATIEGVVSTAEKYYEWSGGKALFGRDAMANYMIVGARQLGQEIFEVKADGTPVFHTDEAIMRKLWDNYYVPFVKGYFTSEGSYSSDDMKLGKIIAAMGSCSSASYYENTVEIDGSSYEIENIVLEAPRFATKPDGTPASAVAVQQGAGITVLKSNVRKERASAEFLKWITQGGRNMQFAGQSGYLPVRTNYLTETGITEYVRENVDSETVQDSLRMGARTMSSCELYTSKPFARGNDARKVVDSALKTAALADRDTLPEKTAENYETELEKLLTDEHFKTWLEKLRIDLVNSVVPDTLYI